MPSLILRLQGYSIAAKRITDAFVEPVTNMVYVRRRRPLLYLFHHHLELSQGENHVSLFAKNLFFELQDQKLFYIELALGYQTND